MLPTFMFNRRTSWVTPKWKNRNDPRPPKKRIILDGNHAKQQTLAWTSVFGSQVETSGLLYFSLSGGFRFRVAFANVSEAPICFLFVVFVFPSVFPICFHNFSRVRFGYPKLPKKKHGNRKTRENCETNRNKNGGKSDASRGSEGSWAPASPFPPGCSGARKTRFNCCGAQTLTYVVFHFFLLILFLLLFLLFPTPNIGAL